MKTPDEIRKTAKERVAAINAGKVTNWTPMDRDNTSTYVGGFEEGYEQAMKDIENCKPN